MSWINRVLESTEESESPEVFQYWSSLAVLSAVVRKNVYLDRFYYKLYPNIYVFLVTRSGMRKGLPVTIAKKILEVTDVTRIISGRNTIQSIIADLGKAYSTEGGEVKRDAQCIITSGEFAVSLLRDPDTYTILTDLYDTHAHEKEWKNTLKHSGIDTLRKPCICLLGATNETNFRKSIPEDAISGGFIARTFMVYSDRKRNINPLMEKPKTVPDIDELAKYPKEVSKLSGPFTMSDKARKAYTEWYYDFSKSEHTRDATGTMERIHDQILKVAMLISLSDDLDLVIKTDHLLEATDRCMECASSVKHITMGVGGKSVLASQTAIVLKELLNNPDGVSRTKILQRYWGELDAIDLDRIIQTLTESGAVMILRHGKVVFYKVTKSTLEMYTKYEKETQ